MMKLYEFRYHAHELDAQFQQWLTEPIVSFSQFKQICDAMSSSMSQLHNHYNDTTSFSVLMLLLAVISTQFSVFVQFYAIGAPQFSITAAIFFIATQLLGCLLYLVFLYWIPAVTLNHTLLRVCEEGLVEDQYLACMVPYFNRKCKLVTLCGMTLLPSTLYAMFGSGGAALIASLFPYILDQIKNGYKDWCEELDNVAYHKGPCVRNSTIPTPI
jgi:hypothetical protein